MTQVVALADPAELADVGGKARNLVILLRAGFPVPPGFCVTTQAYRAVVGERLDDLLAALGSTAAEDRTTLHRLAVEARTRIEQVEIPTDLREQIAAAYAALAGAIPAGPTTAGPTTAGADPDRGDVAVAVRSSATAEDLAEASFAGQQDTYLNIVGADQVVDAVRRCWASLWTDRAVSYRASHGVDQAGVALAVVVQQLVDARAAGVMFTADPVAGTRGHAVIDAAPGLGEAVVSGAVNPDHLVVDTATGLVLERRLGDKRIAIRALAAAGGARGGTETLQLADGSAEACLTDEQAVELATLGADVERHYGAPQDTEWALDADGRFWLTQARPITTLYPLLARPDVPGPRIFLCLSLAQGLTRPLTPMGLAAIRLMGSCVASILLDAAPADPLDGPGAFRTAGMRPFVDATAALRHPVGRRLVLAALGVMEARAAVVVRRLVEDPRFAVEPAGTGPLVAGIGRIFVRSRLPLHAALAVVSPAAAVRRIARAERRLRRELTVPPSATPEQRLDVVQHQLRTRTFLVMPSTFGYAIPGFALLRLGRQLLGDRATPAELQTVLRGLPDNVTTEMDLALWELTEQIRADADSSAAFAADSADLARAYADGRLPRVAQRGLAAFLHRYGHRAVAEIDLGMPRWADEPRHLLGAIRNYLSLDDPALAPPAQFAAGERTAQAMLTELVRRAGGSRSVRGRLVRLTLRRARSLVGLRESPKFLLVLQFALLRAQLDRVGESLVRRGTLDAAADVFFVDLRDAVRGLAGEDLRGVVAANRAAYEVELQRRHIPRILLTDGTEPEATADPAAAGDVPEGSLVGSPASAGSVTGTVRVVLDPVGAELAPGEILVAPSTDPGWTPLFLTAGGLVMEMGGSNSHGAVVAREYGIPAVVGVPDATHRLRTGDVVTVDGASGVIIPAG